MEYNVHSDNQGDNLQHVERPGDSPRAPNQLDATGKPLGPLAQETNAPEGRDSASPHTTTTKIRPATVPTVDSESGPYAPNLPFEEAAPTATIWQAYLHESHIYDVDMLRKHKEEMGILLVFAGLFSGVIGTFMSQASSSLITYGLLLTSLALNISTAFLVILVDQWYWNYLSPVTGDHRVRALTRHFRYKGLLKWRVSGAMNTLQSFLHVSIVIFATGIASSVLTSGTVPLYVFLLTMIYYIGTSICPRRYPDCPYKTPLTFLFSSRSRPSDLSVTKVLKIALTLAFKDSSKVQASKTQSAEQSRIENEVDALHWLYMISSATTIRRLVIQALAGLSSDYIARVEEVFSPHWAEIRDEKERMLMDCMALTREKPPRWIPTEISNIDGRIEPLFRLEVLFPALRREFPSRLFRAHDLDFLTEDISEALSIILCCIDDAHIQKPMDQMQSVRNALAKSDLHHPLVSKNLLNCDTVRKGLFDDPGNFLTDEMHHVLITNIYSPSNNPSESSTWTLAHAAVEYFKPKLLQSLLSFFKEPRLDRDDLDATFFLATISCLKLQMAKLTLASNSTSSKDVQPRAAKNEKANYPTDTSLKTRRTEVFKDILSYIMSPLFTESSSFSGKNSEFKVLFWTCHAHTLGYESYYLNTRSEGLYIDHLDMGSQV